jgi:Copper type II ascorbate-dependent monooxygenase, C-terminal domain
MRMGATRIVGATAILVVMAASPAACSRTGGQVQPTGASPHSTHTEAAAGAVPLRDGERFINLSMPRPYTPKPPNGGTDEYRCFLVDPKLTERVFVTGSQFLPQNAAVVHHAILFRVEPEDVEHARQLDAAAPGDGWTCFGGTGIGAGDGPFRQLRAGAAWIGAWAPGGRETVLAARTGFTLHAGSLIAMQVHYSLLHTGGKPAGPDKSGVRLRVMPGAAALDPLEITLVPGPVELPCAVGEKGQLCDREKAIADVKRRFGEQSGRAVDGLNFLCNRGQPPRAGPTQQCDMKVREAGTVYAVAGHMHLLGRSIKVELNPGTPQAQTLLDIPVYNFDDQNARPLATPVQVKVGDTFRVTCTHDATLRQKLPELRPLPPRYVVWGEGTSDEMCLGIAIWSRQS